MKYRKAVFILAYRKELSLKKKPQKEDIKYLLLKRKLHWRGWEFPKGGIKNKEPVLLAVSRELKEETGQSPIKVKKHNYSGKYNYDKPYRDRQGIKGQTFTLYSAEIKNKKIKLDGKEHSAYKWLPYNKAMKLLAWKNQRESLEIVNRKIYTR